MKIGGFGKPLFSTDQPINETQNAKTVEDKTESAKLFSQTASSAGLPKKPASSIGESEKQTSTQPSNSKSPSSISDKTSTVSSEGQSKPTDESHSTVLDGVGRAAETTSTCLFWGGMTLEVLAVPVGVLSAGTATPIAAGMVGVGAGMMTSSMAISATQAAGSLAQRAIRHQSLSFGNAQARAEWVSLATNTTAVGGALSKVAHIAKTLNVASLAGVAEQQLETGGRLIADAYNGNWQDFKGLLKDEALNIGIMFGRTPLKMAMGHAAHVYVTSVGSTRSVSGSSYVSPTTGSVQTNSTTGPLQTENTVYGPQVVMAVSGAGGPRFWGSRGHSSKTESKSPVSSQSGPSFSDNGPPKLPKGVKDKKPLGEDKISLSSQTIQTGYNKDTIPENAQKKAEHAPRQIKSLSWLLRGIVKKNTSSLTSKPVSKEGVKKTASQQQSTQEEQVASVTSPSDKTSEVHTTKTTDKGQEEQAAEVTSPSDETSDDDIFHDALSDEWVETPAETDESPEITPTADRSPPLPEDEEIFYDTHLPFPVIHPQTQRVNAENLNVVINALEASLPQTTTGFKEAAQRTRLLEILQQITVRSHDAEVAARNDTKSEREKTQTYANMAFEVRDGFDNATKQAFELARTTRTNPKISEGYSNLGLLLIELKRAHFTAGAKDNVTALAESLAADKYSQIDSELNGGGITRSKYGEIGAQFSLDTKSNLGPQTNVAGRYTKSSIMFRDNDGDVDWWPNHEVDLNGGVGIGKSISFYYAKFLANLGYTQGNNYLESRNIVNILKMAIKASGEEKGWRYRSAGPKTRFVLKKLSPDIDRLPFNSRQKLEKGAFNRALIQVLAEKTADCFGDKELAPIIAAGYPTMAAQIEGFSSANPLHGIAPFSAPAAQTKNITGRRRSDTSFVERIDGTLSAGVKTPGISTPARNEDPNLNVGVQASLGVSALRRGFHLERLHEAAAHFALDPSVIKNYPKLFGSMLQLSSHFNGKNASAARMVWADRVVDALEQIDGRSGDSKIIPATFDQAAYGNPHAINREIPQAVINSIARPSAAKLQALTQQGQRLSTSYRRFVEAAEVFRSNTLRSSAPETTRLEVEAKREKALQQINNEAFGGRLSLQELAYFKAHPRELIARAYDAYSLGLGYMGVHLSVLNREMGRVRTQGINPHDTAENRTALNKANHVYREFKRDLEAMNVPLDVELLQRYSSIGAFGDIEQTQIIGNFGTKVGFSAIGNVYDVKEKSGVKLGSLNTNVSNSLGDFSIGLNYIRRNTLKHGNQGRRGLYDDVSIELDQSVLPKCTLTERMINAISDKLGFFSTKVGATANDHQTSFSDIVKHELGTAVMELSRGNILNIVTHTFPNENGLGTYATRVAFVREQEKVAINADGKIAIPVHPGISVTLAAGKSNVALVTHKEVLGGDLNAHMMFNRDLTKDGISTVEEVLQDKDSLVREKLLGGTGFVTVMQDYQDFLYRRNDPGRLRTGFDYFHSSRFRRYNKEARELVHYAPGQQVDDFLRRAPQAPLSEGYKFSAEAGHEVQNTLTPLSAQEAEIRAEDKQHNILNNLLKKMETCQTTDERAEFLLGEGKPLLDLYMDVMAHYNEINGSGFQLAYERHLRDPKGRPDAQALSRARDANNQPVPDLDDYVRPKQGLTGKIKAVMADRLRPERRELRAMSSKELEGLLADETTSPRLRDEARKEYAKRARYRDMNSPKVAKRTILQKMTGRQTERAQAKAFVQTKSTEDLTTITSGNRYSAAVKEAAFEELAIRTAPKRGLLGLGLSSEENKYLNTLATPSALRQAFAKSPSSALSTAIKTKLSKILAITPRQCDNLLNMSQTQLKILAEAKQKYSYPENIKAAARQLLSERILSSDSSHKTEDTSQVGESDESSPVIETPPKSPPVFTRTIEREQVSLLASLTPAVQRTLQTEGFHIGQARGDRNNCLIDSVLQLAGRVDDRTPQATRFDLANRVRAEMISMGRQQLATVLANFDASAHNLVDALRRINAPNTDALIRTFETAHRQLADGILPHSQAFNDALSQLARVLRASSAQDHEALIRNCENLRTQVSNIRTAVQRLQRGEFITEGGWEANTLMSVLHRGIAGHLPPSDISVVIATPIAHEEATLLNRPADHPLVRYNFLSPQFSGSQNRRLIMWQPGHFVPAFHNDPARLRTLMEQSS